MKPPSIRGVAAVNPRTRKYERRAGADGGTTASAPQPPAAGLVGAGPSAAADPDGDTEVAAMQQLAFLVVSLRSDLREANLARDQLEAKVRVLGPSL